MNNVNAKPNPKRWIILAACILAAMVPAIGLSMIAFIAPAIQRNFQMSNSSIGLLASIGLLIISAFILGGGTLGDIYGRKRLLLIGLVGSIFASLLSMAAVSYSFLLAAQILAGASGALVSPLSLAIILVSFESNERPKALGILIGVSSLMVGLSILAIQWLNQSFRLEIYILHNHFDCASGIILRSLRSLPKANLPLRKGLTGWG